MFSHKWKLNRVQHENQIATSRYWEGGWENETVFGQYTLEAFRENGSAL